MKKTINLVFLLTISSISMPAGHIKQNEFDPVKYRFLRAAEEAAKKSLKEADREKRSRRRNEILTLEAEAAKKLEEQQRTGCCNIQ